MTSIRELIVEYSVSVFSPVGDCYLVLGGGTMYDDENQLLYVHYGAGSKGMFVEMVDVRTARIIDHLYFSVSIEYSRILAFKSFDSVVSNV